MEIEKAEEYIAVHGDFRVLSTAAYNGGFVIAKTILNINVNADFKGDHLDFFDSFALKNELERTSIVGLMTAVEMNDARIIEKGTVTAIITAGIADSSSLSTFEHKPGSTVNIILLIQENLSRSAMANVIIVATEAKTAAFYDLDIHDEDGDLFTGDTTDSVVVACYGDQGEPKLFAGKATELGRTIYEVVREGVKDALFLHDPLQMDNRRPMLTRLEERGIYLEDMVSTALELYADVEGEEVDRDGLKKRVEAAIKKESTDVNVALLLAAALHADEQEIKKGRAGESGRADAACIIADELIGITIAEYIGGKRALFNFFYYDTKKPGILSQLGLFMDDAIGGLIAGSMSKLLAEL